MGSLELLLRSSLHVVQGTPFNAVDTTLASGTFSSGKNGQVTATLTSEAPSPSADGVSTTVPDAEFHSVTPVGK